MALGMRLAWRCIDAIAYNVHTYRAHYEHRLHDNLSLFTNTHTSQNFVWSQHKYMPHRERLMAIKRKNVRISFAHEVTRQRRPNNGNTALDNVFRARFIHAVFSTFFFFSLVPCDVCRVSVQVIRMAEVTGAMRLCTRVNLWNFVINLC